MFKSSKKIRLRLLKQKLQQNQRYFQFLHLKIQYAKNPVLELPCTKQPISQLPVYPDAKPRPIRSEKFTLSSEDQATYGSKSFFVIVGSFKSSENAAKFKQELTQQGFKPIILHSEPACSVFVLIRLIDETSRQNTHRAFRELQNSYTKYADAWLLIKK